MGKRTKESKKRINSLILLIAFTAILLIVSTYAWFTTQRDVTVANLKGTVEVAESLEISLDAQNWSQRIEIGEAINNDTFLKGISNENGTLNSNYIPKELLPASTDGSADGIVLPMYAGTLNGNKLSGIIACDETATDTDPKAALSEDNRYAGYFAFDIFLRNSARNSTGTDPLFLNNNTSLSVLKTSDVYGNTIGNYVGNTLKGVGYNGQTYVGDEKSGIQNTVRVGLALFKNTAELTATQAEVRTATVGATKTIGSVAIWEPNSNAHDAQVVTKNGPKGTPIKTRDGDLTMSSTAKFKTFAIMKDDAIDDIANVYDWTDDKLTQQNTVQTETGDWDENGKLKKPEGATGVALKTVADSNTAFAIAKNQISRIRVYVWLEGQDPDCINLASYGGGIELNLGLEK